MKKMMKVGIAALAFAAVTSAFAQEEQVIKAKSSNEADGWTTIAFGIASPVQLPWGGREWDVFGLDINAIWAETAKMYGLGIGGIAMATRNDMMGLQVSGLCNWATESVYGMRATLGGNITFGDTYGFDAGLFSYHVGEFRGWDTEFIGSFQPYAWGLQIAGIANVNVEQGLGASIAIGGNYAKVAYGLQIGGLFNYTQELHGCQIGIVNLAKECPWGFQIGVVNIILDNKIKVLPIVNGYF